MAPQLLLFVFQSSPFPSLVFFPSSLCHCFVFFAPVSLGVFFIVSLLPQAAAGDLKGIHTPPDLVDTCVNPNPGASVVCESRRDPVVRNTPRLTRAGVFGAGRQYGSAL
jgi:hypothetical protein